MELTEIKEKLDTLGIPVAYIQFAESQKLPFIAFLEDGGTVEGADNYNLFRRKDIRIELYTAKKDVKLERKLENLFRDTELEKIGDTWLKDEKMFMTGYTLEIIQYIDDEDE